jgi:hypothetical protein
MNIRMKFAGIGFIPGLLGMILGMAAGCKSRQAMVVEFSPAQPDPAQIQSTLQRDREELAKSPPPGEMELKLIELWKKINLLALSRDQHQDTAQLDQSMAALRGLTGRILEDQGVAVLRRICLRLVDTFETDFQALAAAAVSSDITTALLSGAPTPPFIKPQYDKFVQTAGDFLLHATASGLLKQGSDGRIELPPGGELFLRIGFKVRFANIIPEVTTPLQWLLSDFERKWYNLWVVERSRTSTLQRKLDSVAALKAMDPSYADDTARGIVLFKAQRFDQAKQAFELAVKKTPADPRVRGFLEAARRSIR